MPFAQLGRRLQGDFLVIRSRPQQSRLSPKTPGRPGSLRPRGATELPQPEPIVGALDLGSNSFHLLVVRARPDRSFDVLLSEKEMLRLGEEVGRLGRFSEASLLRVPEVVAGFRARAESLGCQEFVVSATAAFREAENASTMQDEIARVSGLEVEVISGHREAELIFLAIRSFIHIGIAPVIAADLGGGSLEISVGDQRQQYFGNSLRLGVGRLLSKFPHADPLSRTEREEIVRYVRENLRPVLSRATDYLPRNLVVTSGSFNALVRVAEYERSGRDRSAIKGLNEAVNLRATEVLGIEDLIIGKSAQERLSHPVIDEKRNDQLPIGFLILKELIRASDVEYVIASPWALREGLVLDALSKREDFEFAFGVEELRIGSIRALSARFLPHSDHVNHVGFLTSQIAGQVSELLGLDRTDCELVYYAALCHDIGESIAQENHEMHSAYILDSVRLRGFTKEERSLLSSLVRFHRRGTPKGADHPPFLAISRRHREKFTSLLAILRVADALDRSHQGYVHQVEVVISDHEVELRIHCRGDITLELYGLRKKGQLFSTVTGRKLVVSVVAEPNERPDGVDTTDDPSYEPPRDP